MPGWAGPGVHWVERDDDPPAALAALSTLERERFTTASDARRREYATGRHLARHALTALGRPDAGVGTGPHGVPTWPGGVVGSISHSGPWRAAAVAPTRRYAGLGIDVEPDQPLPPGVAPYVLGAADRAALAAWEGQRVATDRLVFCVKEAVYKACWPLQGERLGFHDATVRLRPDGSFRADLLVPGPWVDGVRRGSLHGRWNAAGGVLRVIATLPRDVRVGVSR